MQAPEEFPFPPATPSEIRGCGGACCCFSLRPTGSSVLEGWRGRAQGGALQARRVRRGPGLQANQINPAPAWFGPYPSGVPNGWRWEKEIGISQIKEEALYFPCLNTHAHPKTVPLISPVFWVHFRFLVGGVGGGERDGA